MGNNDLEISENGVITRIAGYDMRHFMCVVGCCQHGVQNAFPGEVEHSTINVVSIPIFILIRGRRDYRTTGLQDDGTTGRRDYRTTGLQDYGTTGLRDERTTKGTKSTKRTTDLH